MSLEVSQHQNLLNDNIMKLEETVIENEKANRYFSKKSRGSSTEVELN